MPVRRIAVATGFAVGLAALVLQFALTIPLRISNGDTLVGALVFYFTFFTILTNFGLVLIYLSELISARWLGWFRSPVTRGMMAGAIALVMVFYCFVLAGLWNPLGWFKVADVVLHYLTPIYYVLWWLVFQPHGGLGVRDLPAMSLPPAIYLAWAMLRGALINEYPYPILEAHKLGYPQVALNVALVLFGLIVLYAVVIGVDRTLQRRPASG